MKIITSTMLGASLFFLLSISLFAQDIITTTKGSARWLFTAVTDAPAITETDIFPSMHFTRAKNDTGSASSTKYVYYKFLGAGSYTKVQTMRTTVTSVEDTVFLSYGELTYTSKNGHKITSTGTVDTSYTPLKTPYIINADETDPSELSVSWTKRTGKTSGWTQIWRKYNHQDSSYSKIDSVALTVTIYADSNLKAGQYIYKVRHRGNNSYSEFSGVVYGAIDEPDYQFSFIPASVYIIADSTAGGSSATSFDTLDFEGNNLSEWTTQGSDREAHTDAAYNGTYGMRVTGGNSYSSISFTARDSCYVTFWLYIPSASTVASGGWLYTAYFGNGGTDLTIFGGDWDDGGTDKWNTWAAGVSSGSMAADATNFSLGEWHKIKMFYKKATSGDAIHRVWVDGSPILDVTNGSSTAQIDNFRFTTEGWAWDAGSYFYVDYINLYNSDPDLAGGGSADSVVTVLAINNSGVPLTINDITGEASPFTIVADSTLPETVADGDTLGMTVTLNKDTSGIFDQTAVFDLADYLDQNFALYAQVRVPDLSDTTAPNAPTNFTATGYYSGGSTYIRTSWTESTSSDKDSIRLYATAIDDPLGTKTWIKSLAEGTTEYNDTTLGIGETRGYYVTQLDDSSNESSVSNADSGLVPLTPTIPPPNAPSNLSGTGGVFKISLTWTDNSTNEDSFRVYRDNVWIKSLAANTVAYVDSPLANNTQYYHYVRAYDDDRLSNPSNTDYTYTSDTTTFVYDRWYVDGRLTTGSNDGTSWANAWRSFSAINWSSIGAGDILYISGRDAGGANDSTVYSAVLQPRCRGTAEHRITITTGSESPNPSGHSGRVIIDGGGTRESSVYFDDYSGTAPTYITIRGLELRRATSGVNFNIDAAHGTTKGIIIDDCYIYDFYDLAGVLILGNADSTVIQNSTIKTFVEEGGQTDCIHVNGSGGIYPILTVIHDNLILNMNQDPLAHNDAIQSVLADGFIIYNNIVINDSVNSPEGGGMPFILSSTDLDYNDTPPVIAFNNFLWMGGTWWDNANAGAVFRSRHDGVGYNSAAQSPNMIFNNTFVCTGPRVAVVDQEWTIRLFINNIVASYCENSAYWDSPNGWFANLSGGSGYENYSEIDSFRTNLYWRMDSLATNGGQYQLQVGDWMHAGTPVSIGSWSNWISNGGTGLFRDPKFVSNFGNTADHENLRPDLQAGSPAIDAGESIRYLYNYIKDTLGYEAAAEAMLYDIYGNARNIDDPSIGAYEHP